MLDGVEVTGTGSLASRLWTKPSATVIGIDVPNVAEASNVLLPEAPQRSHCGSRPTPTPTMSSRSSWSTSARSRRGASRLR